jgi:hypothetical protein
MNVSGTEHLTAVLLELQYVSVRIDLASREGGLNISDQLLLERIAQDIAQHIQTLNARLKE